MQRICVFAGSNLGIRQEYQEAAQDLGRELLARGMGLVYGGASVGLMGRLADSALAVVGGVIWVSSPGLFRVDLGHPNFRRSNVMRRLQSRVAALADIAHR